MNQFLTEFSCFKTQNPLLTAHITRICLGLVGFRGGHHLLLNPTCGWLKRFSDPKKAELSYEWISPVGSGSEKLNLLMSTPVRMTVSFKLYRSIFTPHACHHPIYMFACNHPIYMFACN